jgi:raffinose/stachyose/melibiose transport system permease protein
MTFKRGITMSVSITQDAVSAGAPASRKRRPTAFGKISWWFPVPALLVYCAVIVYPMLVGIGYSFTNWNGLDPDFKFIGLANFYRLVGDPQVLSALKMTFLFSIVLAVVQNLVGLALALALNTQLRTRQPLRLLFFMPVILTPLIISFLWRYIFATHGPLNLMLAHLGLEGWQQNWLGEPGFAAFGVLVASSWQSIGLAMVIYIAGLQSIPVELLEAARIDGASRWQRFIYIVLPMLAPALTVTIVNSLITSMKLFDQIYVLTGGGPGYATETMSTLIYKTAFQFSETGYGSAISVVFTFVIAAVVLTALQALRNREIDNG